jgi:hypothetical protein
VQEKSYEWNRYVYLEVKLKLTLLFFVFSFGYFSFRSGKFSRGFFRAFDGKIDSIFNILLDAL